MLANPLWLCSITGVVVETAGLHETVANRGTSWVQDRVTGFTEGFESASNSFDDQDEGEPDRPDPTSFDPNHHGAGKTLFNRSSTGDGSYDNQSRINTRGAVAASTTVPPLSTDTGVELKGNSGSPKSSHDP